MLATLKTPPNRAPRAGVRGLKTRTGGFCRRSATRAPIFGSQMPKLRRVAKHAATKSASGPSLWLSRDPLWERGGLNLYGIVGNNVIGRVDVLGTIVLVDDLAVGAAIAGAVATGAYVSSPEGQQQIQGAANAIGAAAKSAAGAVQNGVNAIRDLTKPGPGTGTCSVAVHGALQAAVDTAKAAVGLLGKCKPGDCSPVLEAKRAAWLALAVARSSINTTCYGGGDNGHQIANADAWKNVGTCTALMGSK